MITVENFSKHYGSARVVQDASFEVVPGRVTALLGPNGAGKSTTIRAMFGLTTPSAGRALVCGRPYRDLDRPLRVVGSMLDGPGAHPGRSGRRHLRALAATAGIGSQGVDAALARVGLEPGTSRRRVRTYSLGMRQRLGLAAALVGEPPVVILDEPGNGLDPQGQVWLRALLRDLAGEGRTVLVSSHQLPEVAAHADHVVVIAHGRVVADAAVGAVPRRGENLEAAYLRLVGSVSQQVAR